MSIEETIAQEQAAIKRAKAEVPELFERAPIVDGPDELRVAGIELPEWPAVTGYIRYYPQDFIVEEVHHDGKMISTVEPYEAPLYEPASDEKTIYADLIKSGIPTVEAKIRLAAALGIEERFIGTAGIKDARALTSQRISFRGVPIEALTGISIPNLILTRFSYGKGAIAVGELTGNQFTITLRTDKKVDLAELEPKIRALESRGVLNFYGLQRFGSRLRSHLLGLFLLRGEYERVIESLLFDNGPRDLPFFQKIRDDAHAYNGHWNGLIKIYQEYPRTFQYELTVLAALAAGADPVQALGTITEQIKMWIYAYMSFLINRLLSEGAHGRELPAEIPIPLSDKREDRLLYRAWLESDGVAEDHFRGLSRALPYVRLMHRTLETKITPRDVHATLCPAGVTMNFFLPRGAYATTFLMNLFTLSWGQPIPSWIKTDEVDGKALFGAGSVEAVKPYLGEYMKALGAEEEKEDE